MENEFDLDLEPTEPINNNRRDIRVQTLTEKLKTETDEKQKALDAKAEADAKVIASQKEVEFYSSFSDSTSQYPQASEYKDAIKEKVMNGYTVEDATVSILAKEGKLNTPPPMRENIAGGSATNSLSSDGPKNLNEMDRSEKRAALEQLENEGGGLSNILRSGH